MSTSKYHINHFSLKSICTRTVIIIIYHCRLSSARHPMLLNKVLRDLYRYMRSSIKHLQDINTFSFFFVSQKLNILLCHQHAIIHAIWKVISSCCNIFLFIWKFLLSCDKQIWFLPTAELLYYTKLSISTIFIIFIREITSWLKNLYRFSETGLSVKLSSIEIRDTMQNVTHRLYCKQ